ncbi:MAG: replication initiation protein [Oscillospiraceae bacterium]|nr:replication initiation protein [Oscillospiraceae bacterium]
MSKNIDEKDKLYPVTKGNQLIQNSRYNLTLQQQKLVAYAISRIKPQQSGFEWLDISVQDFNKLTGKTGNPGNNDYLLFRDSIMGLSETFFLEEIETDENGKAKVDKNGNFIKRTTNVNWFDFELEERINSKGETVASKGKIKLNEKLNKHLIGLKGVYTTYSLKYIMPMTSKFSLRFYEYIKSYANYGEIIEIDLEELKDVLLSENDGVRDPNKYKKFADFRRRVLDKAIEETNRYTDINLEILEIKVIKRVPYAIVFRLGYKTQVLDKENNPIDMEEDLSPAMFSYKHGASKPVFKKELLKRVAVSCNTQAEKEMWELLQNQYATLANRHMKDDVRIDGGNVQYIDLFNEMIENECLESFINAQLDKYTDRQWKNLLDERVINNKEAYIKSCIRQDIEDWQSFLRRSEKTFYTPRESNAMPEWDITPPKFKE